MHLYPSAGYDCGVCSHAEWEQLRSKFEDAVEPEDLREFVSQAGARLEALIDEIMIRTCAPEHADWVRRGQRRSRPRWVV